MNIWKKNHTQKLFSPAEYPFKQYLIELSCMRFIRYFRVCVCVVWFDNTRCKNSIGKAWNNYLKKCKTTSCNMVRQTMSIHSWLFVLIWTTVQHTSHKHTSATISTIDRKADCCFVCMCHASAGSWL